MTIVLGMRQPQLLSLTVNLQLCAVLTKKGHERQLVLLLIRQNGAEDSRVKWLPPGHVYYLCYYSRGTGQA